jgi:hypothetical protein
MGWYEQEIHFVETSHRRIYLEVIVGQCSPQILGGGAKPGLITTSLLLIPKPHIHYNTEELKDIPPKDLI